MSKSDHYQLQLDDDVVFDSFQHFMKLWKNGKDAFLNINCRGGRAWLSFSTYLGFQDKVTQATPMAKNRKPKASPSKIRRNQARAEAHREKRRQEAEASRLRSPSPSAQSKEINASFNSCIDSLTASVAKAAVRPTPVSNVSLEKTSIQNQIDSSTPLVAKPAVSPVPVSNVSLEKSPIQIERIGVDKRENDCVKTNNQSFEALPTLKEPLVNAKDLSTPHNQQIYYRPQVSYCEIPLGSLAELGRTRPPSKPAPVLTKSVNFNPTFPLPSAGPRFTPRFYQGESLEVNSFCDSNLSRK